MPSLDREKYSHEILKGLEPAAKEQYGIGGVGLGSHGNESDHDGRLRGRVVGDDVVVHLGAEGEVAKGCSACIHGDADGDGGCRGYGEVLDRSVLHAGVDRNHRHVTLTKDTLLPIQEQDEDHLVTKADDRNDSKDIRPFFRFVFDRAWCVATHCVFNHNQKDNIEYGQHTCKDVKENASKYVQRIMFGSVYLPLRHTAESQLFWSSRGGESK